MNSSTRVRDARGHRRRPAMAPTQAGPALSGHALPTNQWWTSALTGPLSQPLWAPPLALHALPTGLAVSAARPTASGEHGQHPVHTGAGRRAAAVMAGADPAFGRDYGRVVDLVVRDYAVRATVAVDPGQSRVVHPSGAR